MASQPSFVRLQRSFSVISLLYSSIVYGYRISPLPFPSRGEVFAALVRNMQLSFQSGLQNRRKIHPRPLCLIAQPGGNRTILLYRAQFIFPAVLRKVNIHERYHGALRRVFLYLRQARRLRQQFSAIFHINPHNPDRISCHIHRIRNILSLRPNLKIRDRNHDILFSSRHYNRICSFHFISLPFNFSRNPRAFSSTRTRTSSANSANFSAGAPWPLLLYAFYAHIPTPCQFFCTPCIPSFSPLLRESPLDLNCSLGLIMKLFMSF